MLETWYTCPRCGSLIPTGQRCDCGFSADDTAPAELTDPEILCDYLFSLVSEFFNSVDIKPDLSVCVKLWSGLFYFIRDAVLANRAAADVHKAFLSYVSDLIRPSPDKDATLEYLDCIRCRFIDQLSELCLDPNSDKDMTALCRQIFLAIFPNREYDAISAIELASAATDSIKFSSDLFPLPPAMNPSLYRDDAAYDIRRLNWHLSKGHLKNPYTGKAMLCINDLIEYVEHYNIDYRDANEL